jgi:hypothetical protein
MCIKAAMHEHQRKTEQAKLKKTLALQSPQPVPKNKRVSSGAEADGHMSAGVGNSKAARRAAAAAAAAAAPRYCICHGPGVGFMLGCCKCDEWFHGACVGLGIEEGVVGKNDDFVCGACSEDFEPKLIVKTPKNGVKAPAEDATGGKNATPPVSAGQQQQQQRGGGGSRF